MEQKNEICLEVGKPDNLKMLTEISFSKEIRRLQDKTQMFNTRISEHFRTRLTHTMEVVSIAERIVEKLTPVLAKKEIFLDSNLVKAIAYAHDIGHTPFGHIGEEKINELLINDCLYFKHNIHSAKILLDPRIIKTNESSNANENVERFGFNYPNYDWRLFDGVIKHTNAYPKQAKTEVKNDPYNLSVYFNNHPLLKNENFQKIINGFVVKYKGLYCENTELRKLNSFIDNYLNYPAALSLEGQIVAIADEISQRISDFDDAIRLYYKSNYDEKYTNAFKELCEDLKGYKKCLNDIKKDITLTTKENTSGGQSRDVKRKIDKRINIKYKTKSKINLQISNYDICNYDGEKTSQFLGSTANYCDVIVKNIYKILECSNSLVSSNFSNRIVYQYRISKKTSEELIEDLITYVTDLVENKEISYDTISVKYKKTNSGKNYETQEYKIFHPHFRYKMYKPIISFPNILDNAISIFKKHNRFMINDQVITMSNIEGQKNIKILYDIYNEDIRRIDSNSKRLIINRVKELDSSITGEITMDKINEKYQSGNMDPALKSIIKQIILEGIARMTDTYVERTINKFDGYKYFDYNIKHSI